MLSALFKPRAVAVIGASNNRLSIGNRIVQNLLDYGYKGLVFPVHPKDPVTLGLKTHASILDIPGPVDVAHMAIPAKSAPAAMEECGQKGVRFVIINSAGFRETGPEGAELEARTLENARKHGVRIMGPNCQGVICSDPGVRTYCNFTFTYPEPGNVAIAAQSGGVGEVINQRFSELGIGVHMYASNGNACDVSIPEIIRYWGTLDAVKVIVVYVESLPDPAAFLEAAAEVAARKPILGMKAGRTAEGAKAAASHTGGLLKTDASVDLVFDKAGVVRLRTQEELVQAAYALSTQPAPKGPRVGIITNTGGPAIIAVDELVEAGLELAPLSESRQAALGGKLHPAASVGNPVDVLATAGAGDFRAALDALLAEDACDSVFMNVVTPFFVDNEVVAREIAAAAQKGLKPVVVNLMTDRRRWVEPVRVLKEAGVPHYALAETAARALAAMAEYARLRSRKACGDNAAGACEPAGFTDMDLAAARGILEDAPVDEHGFLSQKDAYRLLDAGRIPAVPHAWVASPEEAAAAAGALGYPVAIKADAPGLVHKSEAGALALDLADEEALRRELRRMVKVFGGDRPSFLVQRFMAGGTEVIVGASSVPMLGHAVMFGLGGVFVEVLKDVRFKLAPVGDSEALDMIRSIKGFPVLAGARGRTSVCIEALAAIIRRISQMVVALPRIRELDLNPILAFGDAALVADARIRR
ncbi:MAG: acetate--CoA ligase family protein [Elusimicrobia bacterium]|nr:acetate--CoA ligase family protein [Elusimicrobiota bacterium]